jgi:hypothetical protein
MLAMGRHYFSLERAPDVRAVHSFYDCVLFIPYRSAVYIVLIAWLYVVIMIAIVSDSILKGVIRFLFLGALPTGLWLWMSLRRRRAVTASEETPSTSNESSETNGDSRSS